VQSGRRSSEAQVGLSIVLNSSAQVKETLQNQTLHSAAGTHSCLNKRFVLLCYWVTPLRPVCTGLQKVSRSPYSNTLTNFVQKPGREFLREREM
jgi:hypothetical protein